LDLYKIADGLNLLRNLDQFVPYPIQLWVPFYRNLHYEDNDSKNYILITEYVVGPQIGPCNFHPSGQVAKSGLFYCLPL
jgi:hypothetical protein